MKAPQPPVVIPATSGSPGHSYRGASGPGDVTVRCAAGRGGSALQSVTVRRPKYVASGSALMPARLLALTEGPDILVSRSLVLVGRHPHCDVRLPSIRVSRRHCCLTEDGGAVIVRDLGSTNGTLIN